MAFTAKHVAVDVDHDAENAIHIWFLLETLLSVSIRNFDGLLAEPQNLIFHDGNNRVRSMARFCVVARA